MVHKINRPNWSILKRNFEWSCGLQILPLEQELYYLSKLSNITLSEWANTDYDVDKAI